MTDIIEIGKEQAIALLERAVQEKGADYQYSPTEGQHGPTCAYADKRNDVPSCIVGHALAYVGVPVDVLKLLDNADNGWGDTDIYYEPQVEGHEVPADTSISELADSGALEEIAGVRLTREAENIFAIAQFRQDNRATWGIAVADALTEDMLRAQFAQDRETVEERD
jgi:hypothetical protein